MNKGRLLIMVLCIDHVRIHIPLLHAHTLRMVIFLYMLKVTIGIL